MGQGRGEDREKRRGGERQGDGEKKREEGQGKGRGMERWWERQRRVADRERNEGARREREEREDTEQKLRDPGRAKDRVLGPAAEPGLRRVEVGDPAKGSRSAVKRCSARVLGERVS